MEDAENRLDANFISRNAIWCCMLILACIRLQKLLANLNSKLLHLHSQLNMHADIIQMHIFEADLLIDVEHCRFKKLICRQMYADPSVLNLNWCYFASDFETGLSDMQGLVCSWRDWFVFWWWKMICRLEETDSNVADLKILTCFVEIEVVCKFLLQICSWT
jgi:hypothetical protein